MDKTTLLKLYTSMEKKLRKTWAFQNAHDYVTILRDF